MMDFFSIENIGGVSVPTISETVGTETRLQIGPRTTQDTKDITKELRWEVVIEKCF